MHFPSAPASEGAFSRAIRALCLSRDDIARELGVTRAELDEYADGLQPVPASLRLALVGVVKVHEVALEGVASMLFEHVMRRHAAPEQADGKPDGKGAT